MEEQKKDFKKEFIENIEKIDNIYQETQKKIHQLHLQKMELIKNYKKDLENEELINLRNKIKEESSE